MFVFRKKKKPENQIDRLLSLLKEDPENTKTRLRLADLYLRAGNKISAIAEYQTAAQYLGQEGFILKAISIYKKVLTLDSRSLSNYKFLASLYTGEGLLAEAKRTYEKILQIKPGDHDAQEALGELERGGQTSLGQEPRDNLGGVETEAMDDSDPVPIEALLDPLQAEETPPDLSSQNLSEKSFEEPDMGDLSGKGEIIGEGLAPDQGGDFEIDIGSIQNHDTFEFTQSPYQTETEPQSSLHGTVVRDLTDEDVSNTSLPSEDAEIPPIGPSPFDSPQPSPSDSLKATSEHSGEDPNLHYDLGVAYREMELTDKAIEEFTKALTEGTKPLECLIMLAKCHFEKGLFQDAADFIHRALKLESLTQEQIDLLHRQLEEVEAVGKLG